MSDRLDKAIAAFEDETSELTLGERIAELREALIFTTFKKIQEVHTGFGERTTAAAQVAAEEEAKHVKVMKWYKELEKLYTSQVRMNKLLGKKEDNMDKNFLKRIKELKGSMSDIVRSIHSSNGENKN